MTSPERRSKARKVLTTAGAYHLVHDGFTDAMYVLLPIWQLAFNLSLTETGWIATTYLLAMSCLQIPVGFLSERMGERTLLVWGTIVTAAVFLVLGLTDSYATLICLAIVAGAGSSVQHPLASSIVAGAFDDRERRPALATYNLSGDIGKVLFPFTAAWCIGFSGWEFATTVLGVTGLLVACIGYWALIRFRVGNQTRHPAHTSLGAGDWGIHEPTGFALLSLVYVIDSIVRYAFVMMLPFALIAKGLAAEQTGFALSLLFVGGVTGKYLFGHIANWLGVRPAVVLSEVLTGACILAVLALPLAPVYWILPLAGVALNGTSSVLYGSVADFVRDDRRGRAFGLFYTTGMLFSALSPLLAGIAGDELGINAVLVVSAILALTTIPVAIAMGSSLKRATAIPKTV